MYRNKFDCFTHAGKKNLLGHIILDHNKFNVFSAKTNSWNKVESLTADNNYEYNKDFPLKKDSKISGTVNLQEIAKEIKDKKDMFYLGRGLDYALAMPLKANN